MASATLLSPLAAPFHPRYEDLEFDVIYNDGVPSMVPAGSPHPEHEILHNIQDEALDEAFPPDACEAAELDATDDFVMTMSFLGLLEEHEEMSRQDYSHARQKRWAARREMGLLGRPHPPRPKAGLDRSASSESETSIVPYDLNHAPGQYDMDGRIRARIVARSNRQMMKGKTLHGHSRQNIQQPLKGKGGVWLNQPKPKFVAHKPSTKGHSKKVKKTSNRLGGDHLA